MLTVLFGLLLRMLQRRGRNQGIPPLRKGFMPPGIHRATWEQLRKIFGTNALRKSHIQRLEEICTTLARAGCAAIYLGGSMISAKMQPFDFDACWQPEGVDINLLKEEAPELFQAYGARSMRFGGDIWMCFEPVTDGYRRETRALQFLQENRRQRVKVGVLLLDPRELLE
jgi:hypothetical protein